MNKEELRKKINSLPIETSENYPHNHMVDKEVVVGLIEQLDEPEKPVVPDFVGEFIANYKEQGYTLANAIFNIATDREDMDIEEYLREHPKEFVQAYDDGYTVEEQKYILSINITDKASKTNYETFLNKRGIFHSMKNESYNREEFNWTEEEIKELESGEILFEHFATKVEELEE